MAAGLGIIPFHSLAISGIIQCLRPASVARFQSWSVKNRTGDSSANEDSKRIEARSAETENSTRHTFG